MTIKNSSMKTFQLNTAHSRQYRDLMELFAHAFEDPETYTHHKPNESYVKKLLCSDRMIYLVAEKQDVVVGGLVAYVLEKFEQERSEIYIYDLAVSSDCRRQGIATRLIQELREISRKLGAWVIYVQADYVDQPAIKLYESLGTKEEVLHFDIQI